MFVIKDMHERICQICETGTKDEEKRFRKLYSQARSAQDKTRELGLIKDNKLIEEKDKVELLHKINDEEISEALRILNTMKRKMSHEEYLFSFYLVYQFYDGKNRDSVFKQAFKIVEERARKLKEETKQNYLTVENDCVEVFRVGTINGRSWMSSVGKMHQFLRFWKLQSKICGLLNCRVYRKFVCEDDILIYCENNSLGETECILTAKSLRDYSLTERLYETHNENEFSVKDAQDNLIVSMTTTMEGDDFSIDEIEDTEYLFGGRDEKTGELTQCAIKDMLLEELRKSDKRERIMVSAQKAINDMNFNQSVLAA